MRMPLVSVIVPVYNVEKYIGCCVQSILAQTFSDFELILVDDGSPDQSGDICDAYAAKDPRVVVIHKENGGVSSARNLGLDRASGEYITFVDSDDWLEPAFLQEAANMCEKLSLDIYMGGFLRVEASGKRHTMCIRQTIDASRRQLHETEYAELLRHGYISSVCGNLIRRSFIGKRRFRHDMRFGEDLTFVFELLRNSPRCYAVESSYYYYRDADNSLTKQFDRRKLVNVVETYQMLLCFAEENDYKAELLRYIQQRWIADLLFLQKGILQNNLSFAEKKQRLSTLMTDRRLRDIVRKSEDKYCRRYCAYPVLLICYNRYLQIRKSLK